MKKIWLIFIVVIQSGFCLADDKNWYVGLGIGNAKYKESSFSENDNLFSISGGYVFNDFISVDASYIDLGNVKGSVINEDAISLVQDVLALDAKGFTVASVYSWQLTTPLTLSAKLGVSVFDLNKKWSGGTFVDPILAADTGGSEVDLFVGAQLQYMLSDTISLGLNWDRYQLDKTDVDGLYARIKFHF